MKDAMSAAPGETVQNRTGPTNNRGKFYLWGGVAAIAAMAAILFAYGNLRSGPAKAAKPVPVETGKVTARVFYDQVEAAGTANANESIILTSKVSDIVSRVHFRDGQEVSAGALIVEMNKREAEGQLLSARAAARDAERNHARMQDLFKTGNISISGLDKAKRDLDIARGQLAQAEAHIADRTLRAPFSGVLGLRLVSEGALIAPGTAITTLDDVSRIKLDFTAPELFLDSFKPGTKVTARTDVYPGRDFTGAVETLDSRIDPVTRAVKVRAIIPNSGRLIKPGMLLSVTIRSNSRENPAVPESALVSNAGKHSIFLYRADPRQPGGHVAEQRFVRIRGRSPGWVEIAGGLKAGDLIITSGTLRLRPGISVTAKDSAAKDGAARPAVTKNGRAPV